MRLMRLKTWCLQRHWLPPDCRIHSRAESTKSLTLRLKAGDMAPDFTLLDNQWKQIHLSDYRGKKNVVLAFYVLAFKPKVNKELQAYQADMAKLEASDAVVFGIVSDSSRRK